MTNTDTLKALIEELEEAYVTPYSDDEIMGEHRVIVQLLEVCRGALELREAMQKMADLHESEPSTEGVDYYDDDMDTYDGGFFHAYKGVSCNAKEALSKFDSLTKHE